MRGKKARTNSCSSSSNPGSVISCFQPAALLSERLMDFKRVKNDDHPHKWACQIQDRVLEKHFEWGVFFFVFFSTLLVEIWTYASVLTTQLSCLVSQKRASCKVLLYGCTRRHCEEFSLNVWRDVVSPVTFHLRLEMTGDAQNKPKSADNDESILILLFFFDTKKKSNRRTF